MTSYDCPLKLNEIFLAEFRPMTDSELEGFAGCESETPLIAVVKDCIVVLDDGPRMSSLQVIGPDMGNWWNFEIECSHFSDSLSCEGEEGEIEEEFRQKRSVLDDAEDSNVSGCKIPEAWKVVRFNDDGWAVCQPEFVTEQAARDWAKKWLNRATHGYIAIQAKDCTVGFIRQTLYG